MPPVRRSRRLRRQDVEEDGAPYDCFICLTSITVNMYNATATPCCTRRVHRACYQQHVHTSAACGHCRRPFAAQAAIDPIRNPPINEDLAMREAQRQQAIQDLEALLQPGALEARIQQVCVFFILRIVVCVNISIWNFKIDFSNASLISRYIL